MLVGPRGPPPGALPDKPGSSAAGMSSAPQGYYVLTPFVPTTASEHSIDKHDDEDEDDADPPVVIINRGWVPRHLVVPSNDRRMRGATTADTTTNTSGNGTRQHHHHQQQQQQQQQQSNIPKLLEWDRPVPNAEQRDHVSVVVVPTKKETPRMLVAEHNMKERPPRLFWYDLETIQQWIGWKKSAPLQLYMAVSSPSSDGGPQPSSSSSPSMSWPVAPPVEAVGDFKVSPVIHASYAVTWYGLSAAGLYMTRMMLTKGRK